ncbi:MAG: NADH-quinone oxidoreductase subunit L [Gemmatimonadetes bacterium]|jgi:NADH-quinone oxidoreductase subunit L|nr:NADH-quinone oxidoreductase subunit L [Gemmatimonadota bacterium]MBT4608641.1 NADH-quinone oxidoreductase subunit L [Gemmatimonadota bacterium]MBT5059394.1 NADH-quinone oxidoreductase subunit L [Gemmatimonadota bacterium]MBT5146311.1 NADH-quinone oxidoreductase subunit L [Gemmatimonadota bacterium]MBT5591234.1 NADH-quinone oxidoreductase subunit L [Gemmatimonadota bacterium]
MDTTHLIIATTFAPFVSFVIAILFLHRSPRLAQAIVITGAAVALGCAVQLWLAGPVEPLRYLWFTSGAIELHFGFLLDGLNLMFGVVVALITLCVIIYSVGYMAHDPSKTRYFALLAFFEWAMLSFVYAVDLLQSFIFWELVGLASFFLIGFWYQKASAAEAARKAFLMTRIGDVGLLVGILVVLMTAGHFDIPGLLDPERGLVARVAPATLTAITLLIFIGIVGKSAQFPLHTWLPDAMEGPTPVSALLHSATMVAAGVFLMARLYPLFLAAETTRSIILVIATVTALLAATMAMVDRDIKKVLAYSSISQLGFMLMALAAGSLFAGVFHLITHAMFKALLFLCSGLFIHHFATNDLEQIGQAGGRSMKLTTIGLLVGGAALAGVPPLSGFFSKEEIFAALGHGSGTVFTIAALVVAFLTAYYTFRMIFLIVLPARFEPASGSDEDAHGSAEPWTMVFPVAVLTVGAAIGGLWGQQIAAALNVQAPTHTLGSMLPAIGVVLGGIGLAWVDFGRGERAGFLSRLPALQTLFSNGWYIDTLYRAVFVRLTNWLATLLHGVEVKGLDGGFDQVGFGLLRSGDGSRSLQSGWVQFYGGCVVLVIGAIALYVGMGG